MARTIENINFPSIRASLALGVTVLGGFALAPAVSSAHEATDGTAQELTGDSFPEASISVNGLGRGLNANPFGSFIRPAEIPSPVDAADLKGGDGLAVTPKRVDKFMEVARAYWPKDPCNKDPNTNKPAQTYQIASSKDMTIQFRGESTVASGLYTGGCKTVYLSRAHNAYYLCRIVVHEIGHEAGFVTSEPNRTDDERYHDLNTPDSIMNVPQTTNTFWPCVEVTYDMVPQSITDLAFTAATNYIPRLKKVSDNDQDVSCDPYRPSIKRPNVRRRLCYSGEDQTATNGTIVGVESSYTRDYKPYFTATRIPDRQLHRFLR